MFAPTVAFVPSARARRSHHLVQRIGGASVRPLAVRVFGSSQMHAQSLRHAHGHAQPVHRHGLCIHSAAVNPERRGWPRAQVGMPLAVAVEGAQPMSYVARDISAGGALLTEGPTLAVGREAKVMFPMLGRDLVLHGRVMRSETDALGQPRIGMCFRGVPTFVQDLIQNHVLRALGGPRLVAPAASGAGPEHG